MFRLALCYWMVGDGSTIGGNIDEGPTILPSDQSIDFFERAPLEVAVL